MLCAFLSFSYTLYAYCAAFWRNERIQGPMLTVDLRHSRTVYKSFKRFFFFFFSGVKTVTSFRVLDVYKLTVLRSED